MEIIVYQHLLEQDQLELNFPLWFLESQQIFKEHEYITVNTWTTWVWIAQVDLYVDFFNNYCKCIFSFL